MSFAAIAIPAAIAGAGIASNMYSNYKNIESQADTNETNMAIFNKQFDYTKSIQAETWRRDDSELQRRVHDAKNAGLSPLAALNGGSSGSVVSQPSAPHINAPIRDSVMSGVNMDSLVDSMLADRKLDIEQQNADTQAKKVSNDKELANQKMAQEMQIVDKQLQAANAQLQMKLEQDESQYSRSRADSLMQFNKTIALQARTQDHREKMEIQKYLLDDLKSIQDEARSRTGNLSGSYKIYTDKAAYEAAYAVWARRYADKVAEVFANPTRSSKSAGKSDSVSLSGGLTSPALAGGNASVGGTQSTFGSESMDITANANAEIIAWLNENPVPIYRPGNY